MKGVVGWSKVVRRDNRQGSRRTEEGTEDDKENGPDEREEVKEFKVTRTFRVRSDMIRGELNFRKRRT